MPGREDRTVKNVAAQVAYAYKTLSQLTMEFFGPALPLPVQDSVLMPSTAAAHVGACASDDAVVVKTCLAFGGINSALVYKSFKDQDQHKHCKH